MGLFNKKERKPHEIKLDIDTSGLSEAEIAALEAEAVLAKYDRESAFRNNLPKRTSLLISGVLILFSLFQIYTSIWTIPAQQLRPIHLAFTLFLAFLLYPASHAMRKDRIEWYDIALAVLSLCVVLYIPLNYEYIIKNVGNYNALDIAIGVVGMLLLMEACRRVVGTPILIIVGCFLLYAKFGNLIPGSFGHRGYSIKQIVNHMYYTLSGVFGTPLGVSSTFIFLFILFGAFLEKTGVGKLFIDLANAIAGRRVGGPAKVAVISSALQGTVSGSSVANTVSTGSFTIPAMKRLGYKPEFAGAVEAAASTGGQLMPPIMGAAAFLMAESTGFTYAEVVKSAIIPAILYFSGILISVHHEARKIGLKGMPEEEIPKIGVVMKERGHLLLPLICMIYMLSTKVTPTYAALGAILTSLMACSIQWFSIVPVAVMVLCARMGIHFTAYALYSVAAWLLICLVRFLRIYAKRDEREKHASVYTMIKESLRFDPYDIVDALKSGARNVLGVAIACAMAGMIVGTVTLTGLGLKFATGLARIAGDNLYLLLFLTMLSSIVLGMGVPTTANYLITSTICAPAIISMVCTLRGIAPTEATMAIIMSAHLFVFYFGIIADITPPVALAAMAGSAIAKGEPFKTGVTATRIAIGAFIVPYIFVLNPAMLMIDTTVFEVLLNVCTALLGMYALSGGLAGFVQDHCTWYERVLLILGGMGMIIPGIATDLVGLVLVGGIIVLQKLRVKKREASGATL
ncbi:MAG: TRAP transporter permease [Clostridia bacterium]|nr:TRAP transporter permease [Clostridia bacterium]